MSIKSFAEVKAMVATTTDIGTLIERIPDGDRRVVIAGTRTSVRRIAVMFKQGATAEEIAQRKGYLSLAQVYAALAYYLVNKAEIEAELAAEEEEYDRLVALHSGGHTQQDMA